MAIQRRIAFFLTKTEWKKYDNMQKILLDWCNQSTL